MRALQRANAYVDRALSTVEQSNRRSMQLKRASANQKSTQRQWSRRHGLGSSSDFATIEQAMRSELDLVSFLRLDASQVLTILLNNRLYLQLVVWDFAHPFAEYGSLPNDDVGDHFEARRDARYAARTVYADKMRASIAPLIQEDLSIGRDAVHQSSKLAEFIKGYQLNRIEARNSYGAPSIITAYIGHRRQYQRMIKKQQQQQQQQQQQIDD